MTYLASHLDLRKRMAIKEFFPTTFAMRETATGNLVPRQEASGVYRRALDRFIREGQVLAKLKHHGIVGVHHLFQERNTAYLVMEYIEGHTLTEELRKRGRLPESLVIHIMEQLVDALAAVHAQGICHLDIKTDNIILAPDGRVVLLDFGAARQMLAASSPDSSLRVATPSAAPPEVLRAGETGPESDIFELGVLLHLLLTGEKPPPVLERIPADPWTPDHLPARWQRMCAAALQLDQQARPRDVRAWWKNDVLPEPFTERPTAVLEKAQRPPEESTAAVIPVPLPPTEIRPSPEVLPDSTDAMLGAALEPAVEEQAVPVRTKPAPARVGTATGEEDAPTAIVPDTRPVPAPGWRARLVWIAFVPLLALLLFAAWLAGMLWNRHNPPTADVSRRITAPSTDSINERAIQPAPIDRSANGINHPIDVATPGMVPSPPDVGLQTTPQPDNAIAPDSGQPKTGTIHINPKDGAEMVYVPAGEFLMGSIEADRDIAEKPRHRVYLDAYYIYKTEVTVEQYRKFCQATGRVTPAMPEWGWQDIHPIVNVSRVDAGNYAQWAGAALPTEAEWEKAARGMDGRIYPWGNKWDNGKCVDNGDSTKPVGSFPAGASPYGCLDMAGNVAEWCADWYDENYYRSSPIRNPTGPATGKIGVLRGGFWSGSSPSGFRAAYRCWSFPASKFNNVGFRCVVHSPSR